MFRPIYLEIAFCRKGCGKARERRNFGQRVGPRSRKGNKPLHLKDQFIGKYLAEKAGEGNVKNDDRNGFFSSVACCLPKIQTRGVLHMALPLTRWVNWRVWCTIWGRVRTWWSRRCGISINSVQTVDTCNSFSPRGKKVSAKKLLAPGRPIKFFTPRTFRILCS